MPLQLHTSIRPTPLSVPDAVTAASRDDVGGLGLFVGVVRDHDEGRSVTLLEYSAHPIAEAELERVARDVAAGHDVATVVVEHRIGNLAVGDIAVVVAIGAAHRAAALECCRELIDRLKVEVPIWKRQTFTDGESEWVGCS